MRPNRNPLAFAAIASSLLLAACGANPQPLYGPMQQSYFQALGRSSGSLQMHVMPDSGPDFMHNAVTRARRSVQIECYMLTEKTLIQDVIAAKKRGVQVQVMLEQHPYMGPNPSPTGPNQSTAKTLAQAGIQVRWTSRKFRYTHAKILLVDGQTAFVSSANFTYSGLNKNREYIVTDTQSQDVAELERMYQADYAYNSFTPSATDLVISPVNSRAGLFELMKSAKHDIKIQDEEAGDPALDQLLKTKLAEGVHVEALLGAEKSTPAPGEPYTEPGNVVTGRTWSSYGAQVRFQSSPYLHAKAIVVDGQAMYVGSVNLSTNSMDNNREVGIVVHQADLINPVLNAFASDWSRADATAQASDLFPMFGT
ncbi:MAG TPA: phospholipase D-like domain-containing protein [Oscillatoriaceae cyanobacterium]